MPRLTMAQKKRKRRQRRRERDKRWLVRAKKKSEAGIPVITTNFRRSAMLYGSEGTFFAGGGWSGKTLMMEMEEFMVSVTQACCVPREMLGGPLRTGPNGAAEIIPIGERSDVEDGT